MTDLDLRLPIGGAQLDFIEPHPYIGGSNGTVAQNAVYLWRFRVGRELRITTMNYVVVSADGNVDLGFYDSPDGGANLSRVASCGSTAASGSVAIQAIALSAAIVLSPSKDYWIAFATDSASITVVRTTTLGGTVNGAYKNRSIVKANAWSSGLPATIASPAGNATFIWVAAH